MKIRDTSRYAGHVRCVAVILVIVAGGSSSFSAPQRRAFGRTIAGITAGQDRLAMVRSLYGPGAPSAVDDVQSLCYFVEQDQAYLSVSTFERDTRVRSVALTMFPDVTPGCRNAKISSKHLKASGDIGLGDSIDKIVAAFGPPDQTGKLPINGHDFSYADYRIAGGRATCQFEHDKLALIAVELE